MNSGIRHLQISDPEHLVSLPCIVQYPTQAFAARTTIGPYTFESSLDAPVAPGQFPICLISHGGGGSPLLYRSIGTHLSERGYIVVCPEHSGDNKNDRSLSHSDLGAVLRPRHMSLALDAVLADPFFTMAADPRRVAALGHSMGGYTALAMIGAHPYSRKGERLPVIADTRIRAAVLLAPAPDWYRVPGALDDVSVPVLTLAAEHDSLTPADDIRQALSPLSEKALLEIVVVPGAGHFSFLSPFPEAMTRSDFPPSMDPQGFDRERFHLELPTRISSFLDRTLTRH